MVRKRPDSSRKRKKGNKDNRVQPWKVINDNNVKLSNLRNELITERATANPKEPIVGIVNQMDSEIDAIKRQLGHKQMGIEPITLSDLKKYDVRYPDKVRNNNKYIKLRSELDILKLENKLFPKIN